MLLHAAQRKKAHQHVGGRMPCPQLACAAAALPEAGKATSTLLKLLNAEHGIPDVAAKPQRHAPDANQDMARRSIAICFRIHEGKR